MILINIRYGISLCAIISIDSSKPCYLPKLKEGQILSISNSKISKGSNGELDLILTSASVLNIASEDLPTHQITAVGIASASNTAVISELGVQVECTISDYLSKRRQLNYIGPQIPQIGENVFIMNLTNF